MSAAGPPQGAHGPEARSAEGGPQSGQADFAAALLTPGAPCPPGLRAWNGSDPSVRFAVYRNNVLVSLVDALADAFPVCAELVGPEFFRAMAFEYVTARPPRTRSLALYGEDFPDFIAGFGPARPVPYLADVATLEHARTRAYHAAEADPVASAELAIALAHPEVLALTRVACHPSIAVIRSRYAVASLWAAHQGIADIGTIDPHEPEDVLVARVGADVPVTRLPHGGAMLVQSLMAGRPLGEAVGAARGEAPGLDLTAMFGLLIRASAIVALRPAAGCPS